MNRLSRVLFVVLAFFPLSASLAFAGKNDCRQNSITQLKSLSAEGYAVYAAMTDKKFFLSFITCDDLQLGLTTAVHESVHSLTEDRDAYILINGEELPRPHQMARFSRPTVVAKRFEGSQWRGNTFITTYLKVGHATAAEDFTYLLDEMNAYTHDLHAAIALESLRSPDQIVYHRDGLAALMSFVALYVETAEESQPNTWNGLQSPEVSRTVSTLWTQAEKVMASSCAVPDFGADDKRFIGQFCREKAQASLSKILHRAPVCPVDCLRGQRQTANRPF
jgi:hypothetical protein